ncbi:MAG: hypothetical protein MI975_19665 [Cytophagales bacterium]|nr:hypothetical protein [Cytophagales bacterium]
MRLKTFLLIPVVLEFACSLEDPTNGIPVEDILSISISDNKELIANGQSTIEITAQLGSRVAEDQEVIFKTDQGRFQGTGSDSDGKEIKLNTSEKSIVVKLIADVQPNDFVGLSATTNGFTVFDEVAFKPAWPNAVFLTSDKLVVKPDRTDFTTLEVLLQRAEGTGRTSDNLIITVSSSITEGNLQIDIVPFVESRGERAEFRVKSLNEEEGKAEITVLIKDSAGELISAFREIEFKK